MQLDLIYTKDDLILSKNHQDWQFWQNKFEEYKTSISFKSVDELTEFLKSEYQLKNLESNTIELAFNQINGNLLLIDFPKNSSGSLKFKVYNDQNKL